MKKITFFFALLLSMVATNMWAGAEVALDRSAWSICAYANPSSAIEGTADGRIAAAIDSNNDTFFHSDWGTGSGNGTPQSFLIDMGANQTISSISFLPRQNGGNVGAPVTGRVYVYTVDDVPFTDYSNITADNKATALGTETLGDADLTLSWAEECSADVRTASFAAPVTGRYILLVADATTHNTTAQRWLCCAEFNAYMEVDEINYTVNVLGSSEGGVIYDETTYTNGQTITVSSNITLSELTAVEVADMHASIAIVGTNINVTYTPDWTPSIPADYVISTAKANTITPATNKSDNTHWYVITQKRGGETLVYNNGSSTLKRVATTANPATAAQLDGLTATDNLKYLVRFTETPYTGVYNIQFGDGSFIQSSLITGNASSAGKYFFYNINSTDAHFGWNITSDGVTYGQIVDNNGAGNTLAFWDSGKVNNTGGNNDWYVYAVTFTNPSSMVDITYQVLDSDLSVLWTKTVSATIGSAYPTVSNPNPFITLTGYPTGTVSTDETVTLTYTSKCECFDAPASVTQWYALDMHSNQGHGGTPLYYNEDDDTYVRCEFIDNITPLDDFKNGAVKSDNFAWAFIGNPFTGVKLYNKVAEMYVSQPSDADVKVQFNTTGDVFSIGAASGSITNSFSLKVAGRSNYLNHRGEYVQGWVDADEGSSFRAFPITPATVADMVSYTFSADYGTLIVPFYAEIPEDLEVFTCSSVKDNVLTLTAETSMIKPGVPYIIKSETGSEFDFLGGSKLTTPAAATVGLLTGVFEATIAPVGSYVLQNNDDVLGFYQVATDAEPTVGANRCYLTLPEPEAKALFFDEATAIESIHNFEQAKPLNNSSEFIIQNNGKFLEKGKIVIVKNNAKYNVAGQMIK